MFQQTRITRKLHGALFNMKIILQKASVRSIIFNKKNFGPKKRRIFRFAYYVINQQLS